MAGGAFGLGKNRVDEMREACFAFAAVQIYDLIQTERDRLPKRGFRQGTLPSDFRRQEGRGFGRLAPLDRLSWHPLERSDRRGDERDLRFRDHENVAV